MLPICVWPRRVGQRGRHLARGAQRGAAAAAAAARLAEQRLNRQLQAVGARELELRVARGRYAEQAATCMPERISAPCVELAPFTSQLAGQQRTVSNGLAARTAFISATPPVQVGPGAMQEYKLLMHGSAPFHPIDNPVPSSYQQHAAHHR